ncbi:MAG: diguanylate cyclase [Cyanobacteria bacterium P01_H01_bin.74]
MAKNQAKENKTISRTFVLILIFLATLTVLFLMSGVQIAQFITGLEKQTYDVRARLSTYNTSRKPTESIVIVAFDDSTFNLLNEEYGVWPWSRSLQAQLITYLNTVGVKKIIYDIMFVGHRKGDQVGDQAFIEAFKKNSNVYLSMNFDNQLSAYEKLGKALTPKAIERLKSLSIPLAIKLTRANQTVDLIENNGLLFFDNANMMFNHYRSIMPELLDSAERVGFINHEADLDGISRGNPLFYSFQYYPFVRSQALPLVQRDGKWVDQKGRYTDKAAYLYEKTKNYPLKKTADNYFIDSNPNGGQVVDQSGYFLDSRGNYSYQKQARAQFLFFPYLSLKVAADIKKETKRTGKITYAVSQSGEFHFGDQVLPLRQNGDFLINWYNSNKKKEQLENDIVLLKQYQKKLEFQVNALLKKEATKSSQLVNPALSEKNALLNEIKEKIKMLVQQVQRLNTAQPYEVIPAWQLIGLMKKQSQNQPLSNEETALKQKLKNKMVLIGSTAVASYDLKNTSIGSKLPGVFVQATLLDNLLHPPKNGYIVPLSPIQNTLITICLLVLVIYYCLRFGSPWLSLIAILNSILVYLIVATVLFSFFGLTIAIVFPVVAMLLTTLLTFVTKYILRNRDYEKTYVMATTDSMTGLYNHRFFQDHMLQCVNRAQRNEEHFSLLLIDIDFFKKFNDTHGHQAGDKVLCAVAKKLEKNVRTVDIVARYGGEEMAIVLDHATHEEAMAVANKIVQSVAGETYTIATGVSKPVTISCGVATYPLNGRIPNELIEHADMGLYAAKKNGRNQVGYHNEGNEEDGA